MWLWCPPPSRSSSKGSNGKPLGYIPNEKGVRRDELVLAVDLRPGRNVLVLKLQRFWERSWLFYASLSDP